MSFVARDQGRGVGAVFCGHDGRRGYLHHLAVAGSHRGQGIGKSLVRRCLKSLSHAGIIKCNVFLFDCNTAGVGFWQSAGSELRNDLKLLQSPTLPGDSGK
jgi:N-acetylglutamate synthase